MLYDIVTYGIVLHDIAYYIFCIIYEFVSHDNVSEYDIMYNNIALCDIVSSDIIVLYDIVLVYNKIQCCILFYCTI